MRKKENIKPLKINFSKWMLWENRADIKGIENPGVYVLARFKGSPDTVNLQTLEIVYIGEACSQSLRQRLRQFDRSAFEGKEAHSGGSTYRELFGSKKNERLFVSAFPVSGLEDKLRPFFIRYVERELIWKYAEKWGVPPKCNQK